MSSQVLAFLLTLAGVTLAEMGDKTQLLAMAFAAKYKPKKVFLGITIAIVLLSSTAVAVGNYITRFEGLQIWIQSLAAISFIGFGLWTLSKKEDAEEENAETRFKLGPVMTVAIAFFIAELGDKTQLATMAFAAKFPESPIGVFLGGTFGLIIANLIGIGLGDIISRHISEKTMTIISASVFMLFGLLGSYQVATGMLGYSIQTALIAIVSLAALLMIVSSWLIRRQDTPTNEAVITKDKRR